MNFSAMTTLWNRRLCAMALGLTLGMLASSAAWAQIGSGPVGTTGHAGRVPNNPEKPPEKAPDAVPGARARDPVAPATRPVGDMQPTDALFDAINRGDIAAARDALNRGADLNGVSILGMTPLELSVDLGRNDISFLLLSMRGEDSGRGSRAVGRDTPSAPPPGMSARAGGKPAGPVKSAGRAPATKAAQAASTPPARKAPAAPKLFANDGGTPLPSAGFLGFDSRSASN
ncbi:MAG TPA: hypothetical protein VGC09_02225 [Rhodopila sp.]